MLKRLIHFVALLLLTSGAFAQAQRLVLFEEFTGENCGPCAGTNPYVQTLIDAYPNNVVWVRYQSPIPTAGTIYYQDVADDNTRMTYYGVNSAPWGQQDGAMWDSSSNILTNYGNQPITWCADPNSGTLVTSYLTTESAVSSPFTITVTDFFTAAADSFYATVTVTGAENYVVSQTGKLKLRFAMLENLSFTTPPGNNGETQFPDVVRKMYPSAAGTTMPDSSANLQVQVFHCSGKMPAYLYDKTQVRFVAFIQDDNNLHVQQAGLSSYTTLPIDAKAVTLQGSFVVCDTPYAPVFNFTNNGTQTLTSAVIKVKLDATQLADINWTGSLAPAASTTVNIPGLSPAVGSHNLSAAVTNPNGSTDVNPGNDTSFLPFAITSSAGAVPLVEGFESTSPGWFVQNVAGGVTWARASVGDGSSYSYEMDFWDAAYGAVNNLYAPTIDLTGITNPKMKFSYADAQYDFGSGNGGLSQDSLYILASTDCGNTWTTVFANGGTPFATVAAVANAYSPVAADWRNDTVDLSAVANNANVIIQFNAVSGNGNNLFLDNINIYNAAPLAIKPISNISALSIFPYPTSNLLNVNVQLAQSTEVSFEVTNTLGQVVLAGPAEIQNAGNNSFTINTAKMQSGVYYVSFIAGTEKTSKMFAVIH